MTPETQLGKPAKGLPRYYMDCGWYRHPRFAGLGIDALFVFEAAVGYCTEHGTDGVLPRNADDLALAIGVKASTVRRAIAALVDRHALEDHGELLHVRSWADHNPTSAEVQARAYERSVSGRRGNHERWHVKEGVVADDCEFCASPNGR